MATTQNASSMNISKAENAVMTIEGLKSTSFLITSFNIPGISTGVIDVANPFKVHSEPGTKLTFEELSISMLVAEDFSNWLEILDWIKEGNNGYTFSPSNMTRRTGNIFLTTNNMNVQSRLTFYNMFPISLSSIDVDLQQVEPMPLISQITLVYERYKFTPGS